MWTELSMKTSVLYQRPFKNHSLHVAKQYVPPYSLSNAVALDLEEELQKKYDQTFQSKEKTEVKKTINRKTDH